MKKILVSFLMSATLLWLAGCATKQPTTVAADPTILRVGITPNSPPMIFKEGGKIVGVEADFAQALGSDLSRKVVFVEFKWEDLIPALVDDKVDIIMSSMSITPARRYQIAFSNPYLKTGQMALVRSDEKYKYMLNLAETATRGVGLEPGTTAEQLVRELFPRAKVKYIRSGEGAATAVADKQVDLFLGDSPLCMYLAGRYESKGLTVAPMLFTEEYLGWGVRRTDDTLRNEVNSFLQKTQQSGDFTKIVQRWIPGYR